jgi:hypothetical protein
VGATTTEIGTLKIKNKFFKIVSKKCGSKLKNLPTEFADFYSKIIVEFLLTIVFFQE